MKGNIVIPGVGRDFEVAHRTEAGVHWLEVSVGSSFNELYWDVAAKSIVSQPDTYDDLIAVMRDHGAGWLVDALPALARGDAGITLNTLKERAQAVR